MAWRPLVARAGDDHVLVHCSEFSQILNMNQLYQGCSARTNLWSKSFIPIPERFGVRRLGVDQP